MKFILTAECAVLLHITIFTLINAQQSSSIASACNAAADCTECMTAHKTCNWCKAVASDMKDAWSPSYPRCDTYTNLIDRNCGAEDITNITTEVLNIEDLEVRDAIDASQPAIQLSPQKLHIKLRPNEKRKVNVTFRLAKDYPVDLYYLMDLSQSMKDDKLKVANLGITLVAELRKLTKDVKLGFGSFVDKVLMPYVNTLPDRLISPCVDCESPYSFKHRLKLTADTSVFTDRVNQTLISGNLDEPEGGFDALMQAIVCSDAIGWRPNSRKMLIFSTDAPFHSAGDGKLGGVVEPNDGKCHMVNNEYTWGDKQDYPSISQVAAKVEENRMNIIFAVTQDQTDRYQALSNIIAGSVTGELASDSSNIVKLVKDNYEKISSEVTMTYKRGSPLNEFLRVGIQADCNNESFSGTPEPENKKTCRNLAPGGRVQFQVELQATSCSKEGRVTETFEVFPTGLTESFTITAEVDCSCECGDTEEKSSYCSDVGTYQCGICDCGDSGYGDRCQCDMSTIKTDTEDFYDPCKRPSNSSTPQQACSGRGECVCGSCEVCDCLPGSGDKSTCKRYNGKYCHCNPDYCPRNSKGVCSGRGKCTCDVVTTIHTCQCDEGYTNNDCDCQISNDTCRDPNNPDVYCNEQGSCVCGECVCKNSAGVSSERYTGRYCEECSTCASKCQDYKRCVQCYVYEEKGWNPPEPYDDAYCQEKCYNDSSIQFTLVETIPEESGMKTCSGYTGYDDCQVSYGYKYAARTGYTFYIEDEKKCPYKPNLIAIILGVVGGIVFIGIIILLIWRLLATLHDRRTFAKFEKECQQAQWTSNENPIYKQATSTFKNPMYQGSMKKS